MDGDIKELKAAIDAGLQGIKGQVDGVLADVKSKTDANEKRIAELLTVQNDNFKAVENRLLEVEQKGTKHDGGGTAPKSLGQELVESQGYKDYAEGRSSKAKVELKNTILGTVSNEPSTIMVARDRMPGLVPGSFRQLTVADLIPTVRTASNAIEYARELSFTNDAAETNEGAAKPESDLTFELATAPVRTIAHFIKASKQLLEDAPAMADYIDRRMAYGVRLRLENQIINGNGTTPNLSGLLDTGNFTPFTPEAGENLFDAVNRAKYEIWSADYIPDTVIVNPQDWGAAERTRASGGNGQYVAAIAYQYLQTGMQPTLWGMRVAVSAAVPEGTFIVFDSNAVMLWVRQGVTVEVFEQDSDNVQKNLVTIRAEMRAAFTVFRPAAITAGDIEASA